MILDDHDEAEPAFEDACDWTFITAWRLGQLWEQLRTSNCVKGVVPSRGAEMVMRMAEAKGLPCRSQYLSDRFMYVTFGTPAENRVQQ